MNRGSALISYRRPSSIRRFNEAPIHESGKLSRRNPDPVQTQSFNEAPIHESGK